MNRFSISRAARGGWGRAAFALSAFTILALQVQAQALDYKPGQAGTPVRPGTPSFLGAVDTTLHVWSAYFQKWSIYALIGMALLAAYLFGLIIFQILFASGTFAPRAASVGAWFGSLVLLFFGLMMLPPTWPWWAPYAFLAVGLLMIAVMISSLSKKAA